jgi:hypothetical protein
VLRRGGSSSNKASSEAEEPDSVAGHCDKLYGSHCREAVWIQMSASTFERRLWTQHALLLKVRCRVQHSLAAQGGWLLQRQQPTLVVKQEGQGVAFIAS